MLWLTCGVHRHQPPADQPVRRLITRVGRDIPLYRINDVAYETRPARPHPRLRHAGDRGRQRGRAVGAARRAGRRAAPARRSPTCCSATTTVPTTTAPRSRGPEPRPPVKHIDPSQDPSPNPPTPTQRDEAVGADVPRARTSSARSSVSSPSLTVDEVVGPTRRPRALRAPAVAGAGVPRPGRTRSAFTQADRDAMGQLSTLVETGALDLDTAVRLTRAVGHTMARLADWQVATLSEYRRALEQAGRGHRLATDAPVSTSSAASSRRSRT